MLLVALLRGVAVTLLVSSDMVPSSRVLNFLLCARLALPEELLDEPWNHQSV